MQSKTYWGKSCGITSYNITIFNRVVHGRRIIFTQFAIATNKYLNIANFHHTNKHVLTMA